MATPDIAVQLTSSAEPRNEIVTALRLRRWTRDEYDRMIDAGILTTQDKVQLIEGEIVEMTPQHSPHATSLQLVTGVLTSVFQQGYHVRTQVPLALSEDSEPEPDAYVVIGSPRDYRAEHPTTAVLVVEISESTLKFDRTKKARIYARAGIQDYWIVNLDDRRVEVHRDPVVGPPMHIEPRYETVTTHQPGESISPLAMPNESIAVDDLLP